MMKENTRLVWDYIAAHDGEDFTSAVIAEATGLTVKQVDGSVTSFQKKGLTVREAVDAPGKVIKYIRLTDAGRAFDPDVSEG